jgi:hypothetical protein
MMLTVIVQELENVTLDETIAVVRHAWDGRDFIDRPIGPEPMPSWCGPFEGDHRYTAIGDMVTVELAPGQARHVAGRLSAPDDWIDENPVTPAGLAAHRDALARLEMMLKQLGWGAATESVSWTAPRRLAADVAIDMLDMAADNLREQDAAVAVRRLDSSFDVDRARTLATTLTATAGVSGEEFAGRAGEQAGAALAIIDALSDRLSEVTA